MPPSRNILRLLLLWVLAASLHAQGSGSPPPPDPYTGFVGKWIGSNEYVDGADLVTVPLQLAVSEDGKHARMRFDYTFGQKGKRGYRRQTSFVVLHPAEGRMSSHSKGLGEEHYRAVGLENFARHGSGEFTVTGIAHKGRHAVLYRGTFHLEAESFSYTWETSSAGSKFAVSGVNSMVRDTSIAATP